MRFARVTGTIVPAGDPAYAPGGGGAVATLVVALDDGVRVTTVRSAVVPLLADPDGGDDLAWSADQYTQETLAVDLAEAGWEVVGQSGTDGIGSAGPVQSPTWLVRYAGGPATATADAGDAR
jgi:hypothetical protein